MRMKLIIERLDKEGRLLERRKQLTRSFLIQFIDLLYICHADASRDVRDISNTLRAIAPAMERNLQVGAPGGGVGVFDDVIAVSIDGQFIGIQVGTGVTAPTPTDYTLETRTAHGEAASQLLYGGTEIYGFSFVNPNGQFTIRRYFTNVSGGAITINEAGIYAMAIRQVPSIVAYAFCIARDLVAPGVTVLNNEILRVTYVPQITV